MSTSAREAADLLAELRFALDEGDAERPPERLFDRVLQAALEGREPGRPIDCPEPVGGPETYTRGVASLEAVLVELAEADWASPALRGLDVQGLLGHLIGVEETFMLALVHDGGGKVSDHVDSTQSYALAQAGKPPAETLRQWQDVTSRSIGLIAAAPPERLVAFYGVALPLDQMLVIRAFEMWIHEEDIRLATGQPLNPPDPQALSRMAQLAVTLLPAGIARAGLTPGAQAVRLVLTGTAGGTWTVVLDDCADPSVDATATVVIGTTAFCRVVGNRLAPADTRAWVDGDPQLAAALFAGAAALALD